MTTAYLAISSLLFALFCYLGVSALPEMARTQPKGMVAGHAITTAGFSILYLWGTWLVIARFF